MLTRIRLTPVLCTSLGAVFGFYFLSSLPRSAELAFTFIAITALCFFRVLSSMQKKSRSLQITAVLSVVFTVGLLIGTGAGKAGVNEVKFSLSEDRIIALEGVMLEDPRIISAGRAMAAVSLRKCAGKDGLRATSSGEITVFFSEVNAERLREFGRGTTIFIEGKLRSSETGYTYSAQSLHIVKQASAIEKMRTGIRLNLIKRFDGTNWGGLALALLLGIKDNLDAGISMSYRDAGCSYILALSGMHLAVLAGLIAFLLKKPLGLKPAAIAGAVIICLYCFLTGPMPSLYRAALMYLLGVVAIIGILPKEPMSILGLSFLIQIIISPASGNSLSFILSYLALAGILVIGQPLYRILSGKVPDFLMQPLSASCGAFLATAGVTGFTFKTLAPVGIFAGLALVPLTTVFMIGSLVWLALDFISLSFLLNIPLSLLYTVMEKIVSLASGFPRISSAASAVMPITILTLSLLLSFFIPVLDRRRRSSMLRLQPFP